MKALSTFELEEKLALDGADCIINFQERIQSDKVILDSFLKAIRDSGRVFKKSTFNNVQTTVLSKCCNAYNNAQTSLYKTNKMLQNCADVNKLQFRVQFKALNRDDVDEDIKK